MFVDFCWLFFQSQDWSDWWNFCLNLSLVSTKTSYFSRVACHSTYFGVSYKPQWNQFILDHFYEAKNVHSIFLAPILGAGAHLVGIRYQLFGDWLRKSLILNPTQRVRFPWGATWIFIRERRCIFFTEIKGMKITRFKGFKDIFFLDVHPNFVGKMMQFFSGRFLKWVGEPTITERIMFEPEPIENMEPKVGWNATIHYFSLDMWTTWIFSCDDFGALNIPRAPDYWG